MEHVDPDKTPTAHMCAWGMLPSEVPDEVFGRIVAELISVGWTVEKHYDGIVVEGKNVEGTIRFRVKRNGMLIKRLKYLHNVCRLALGMETFYNPKTGEHLPIPKDW